MHRCEVHGAHDAVDAVGFFICTGLRGETIYLWGCEECRVWFSGRHPESPWVPWGQDTAESASEIVASGTPTERSAPSTLSKAP